ncbi:AMP-binding protein [Amycolatopsis sp. Poz14]|nr:AMP-binding protein [Amycolatopsis sp. Poz14]
MHVTGGQFTPVTVEDARRFRRDGHWSSRSVRSLLARAAERHPERLAVIGYRGGECTERLTYAELSDAASEAAGVLTAAGVGPGDAVAVMLPSSAAFASIVFALSQIGAVYTGVPASYGERQVLPIVRRSRAKILVLGARNGNRDLLALARRVRREAPELERVVVVDDPPPGLEPGEARWSDLAGTAAPEPADTPDSLCYLGFTSGTTGEPKGAMHTSETLVYAVDGLAEHLGDAVLGRPMVQVSAFPAGHHAGYVWGVLFPALLSGTAVHLDRWNPAQAAGIVEREQATMFFGAPTHLQDLVRTELAEYRGNSLSCVVISGSSVPRTLPEAASQALGAYVAPAWGMTECSILTACTPLENAAIQQTDGSPFAGSEVRVVDEHFKNVAPGEIGELLMRGPGVTLGYFDREGATRDSFVPGRWFRTGDTAAIDERGRLSLHGRTKDIIVRGGENIPVVEIETLLFDHPAVLDAAVVGYPDERLGERACAVLRLKEGATLELAELGEHLLRHGLSKHYLPERLLFLDELPKTQSGKIRKFELRNLLASAAHVGQP